MTRRTEAIAAKAAVKSTYVGDSDDASDLTELNESDDATSTSEPDDNVTPDEQSQDEQEALSEGESDDEEDAESVGESDDEVRRRLRPAHDGADERGRASSSRAGQRDPSPGPSGCASPRSRSARSPKASSPSSTRFHPTSSSRCGVRRPTPSLELINLAANKDLLAARPHRPAEHRSDDQEMAPRALLPTDGVAHLAQVVRQSALRLSRPAGGPRPARAGRARV